MADSTAWSGATSAANALMARGAHRIFDALERSYPEQFLALSKREQATIIKALLLHRARFPEDGRALVEEIFGPAGPNLWQQRRSHVQRLFGFGIPDIEEAIGCLESRATLWGSGSLTENQALVFALPLPEAVFGNRILREVTTTLAWLSPILPGRRAYKAVRLDIEEPTELGMIGVGVTPGQVQKTTAARGTVLHRSWSGSKLRALIQDGSLNIHIARKPDQGDEELPIDVAFGVAVSIESAEVSLPIYEQVRAKVQIKPQVAIPIPI
jgi:hypothetical protein